MSNISLVQNVSYRIQLNYPNPGGNPPAILKIIWSLKRNGQVVSGINFPSPVSFEYETNHPSSILSNVVLNPSGSANISFQEGDELSVRVEARNAVSSVPVFLEASVIINELLPNVVLEPITLRYEDTPFLIIDNNFIPFDSDNNPSGKKLFVGGPTTANISPVTYWENISLREYIWEKNNVTIATTPTYTLQEEDKDSIISVTLIVRNSNSVFSRKINLILGNPQEETGWTDLTEYLDTDSRIVYVSNDGNDNEALVVKGRGYYLPNDPEIGSDPTNPIGPIVSYSSIKTANSKLRDNSDFSLVGEPEWLLLKRGDTFTLEETLIERRTAGRSNEKRRVYSAYGSLSENRPKILLPENIPLINSRSGSGNYTICSIEIYDLEDLHPGGSIFRGNTINMAGFSYLSENILVEDCNFLVGSTGDSSGNPKNLSFRRCVGNYQFSPFGHSSGIFASMSGDLLIEECIFDMNGSKENPLDPSTWTAGVLSTLEIGALPEGTGVQPTRSSFNRNCYLSSYGNLKFRGNIISRNSGSSSVQMRVGGFAERNVFLYNNSGLVIGHPEAARTRIKDALIFKNVVINRDHMLAPGVNGDGLKVRADETSTGMLIDNIVSISGGGGTLLYGSGYDSSSVADNAYGIPSARKAGNIIINNNIALSENVHACALFIDGVDVPDLRNQTFGVLNAEIKNNSISIGKPSQPSTDAKITMSTERGNRPETHIWSSNKYFAPRFNPDTGQPWTFAYNGGVHFYGKSPLNTPPTENGPLQYNENKGVTFLKWQQQDYDLDSVLYENFIDLAIESGWKTNEQLQDPQGKNGWERDILSYMRFVDPNYVPNDDITTDDFVPMDKRRPNAQKIRDLFNLKTAQTYHAFLTFIERAKANRKGNWNVRYTADALNDYIREGFGKSSLFVVPNDPTSPKLPYTEELPTLDSTEE